MRAITKFSIAISIAFLSTLAARAQVASAPMGFTWGQSVEDIENLISITERKETLWITTLVAKEAPINPPYTEKIEVIVDEIDGLAQIDWTSQRITNDPAGILGMFKYYKMVVALINKYGQPTHKFRHMEARRFDEINNFYQCLNYESCGQWFTAWSLENIVVLIELKGVSKGVGYIFMSSGVPNYGHTSPIGDNEEKSQDAGTLKK